MHVSLWRPTRDLGVYVRDASPASNIIHIYELCAGTLVSGPGVLAPARGTSQGGRARMLGHVRWVRLARRADVVLVAGQRAVT